MRILALKLRAIRRSFLSLALCLLVPTILSAQNGGDRLAATKIELSETSEVGLEINARSPNASWGREGAEAAAVTIDVDGKYQQDLLLWAGADVYSYRVSLGRLAAGEHQVSINHNAARSARRASRAAIESLRPLMLAGKDADADDVTALTYAPFLHARANTIDRFTDWPLAMYYEVLDGGGAGEKIIRYTTIFSHEDGGTPGAALMARWGRMTDIEWTYELRVGKDGRVVAETYQGAQHVTKAFAGERVAGSHPLMATATDNNNFSDRSRTSMRFAPFPFRADLSSASREAVMDARPELYRVMAEELNREKRVGDAPQPPHIIADPRRYLYLEGYGEQQGGATLAFEVHTNSGADSSTPLRSDLGDARLRIERSGYFRSALFLPTEVGQVKSVSLRCYAAPKKSGARQTTTAAPPRQQCREVRLTKVVTLDGEYAPREVALGKKPTRSLAPGEAITVKVGRQASASR